MGTDYALEIEGLSKNLGSFHLKDISLKLPKGYILGYVGQNGAGKTTTIKLITEIYKHSKGTIKVDGRCYDDDPVAFKDSLGFVADQFYYPNEFTVSMVEKTLMDFYKTFDPDTFRAYLKKWRLPMDQKVAQFSKGMMVKLMLAGVLSRDTKLLILDEATSGLDPVVRTEVLDIIQEYIADGERSVLFSTHIMDDLEQIADYIAFIDHGSLLMTGPKDELIEEFVIVKGGNEDLTRELERHLIGCKKNHLGFEGLLPSDDLSYTNCRMLIEKPSIDKIIIYHIEGIRGKSYERN